jgi:hypothetical protein
MAVLMRTELQGVTPEQIRPLITQVSAQLKSFPGFIAQAAGPIPGGFQVSEVWETEEAHERWLREVVGPLAAQMLGLTEIPPYQYLPLDAYVTR